jgi:hypothetical protein
VTSDVLAALTVKGFWVVTQSFSYIVTDVSEGHASSIFRVEE